MPEDPSHPTGRHDPAGVRLGLGDLRIASGDHLGHFYETRAEWLALAVGWLIEGLRAGQKCIYVMSVQGREWMQLREALRQAGVDTRRALESGQLEIREGVTEPASMETALAAACAEIPARWSFLRWGGDMIWSREHLPTSGALMQIECVGNGCSGKPVAILCQYDLTRFPGYVILDALRAHPRWIVADAIHHADLYEPPEAFRESLARREKERETSW